MTGSGGHHRRRSPIRWIGLVVAMLITAAGGSLLAGAVTGAGVACACSCYPAEPQELIEGSTVVVGRMIEVAEEPTGGRYIMEVERSYGRELPRYIIVNTASPAGACGFFPQRDELTAIVLGRSGGPPLEVGEGEYRASLCANLGVDVEQAVRYGGTAYDPVPVQRPSLDAAAPAPETGGWFDTSRIILIAGLAGVVVIGAGAVVAGWRRRS